jgi:hypothetical protein
MGKKINELPDIVPQMNFYTVVGDPTTGEAYKIPLTLMKEVLAASGYIGFMSTISQATYQDNQLINALQAIVTVEGAVLSQGPAFNQYTFDASSGTIFFNQPLSSQNVYIIYSK